MNAMQTLVALWTLVLKEIKRFTRIWPQTLLPPSITMAMYFIIFGSLIGSRRLDHLLLSVCSAPRGLRRLVVFQNDLIERGVIAAEDRDAPALKAGKIFDLLPHPLR